MILIDRMMFYSLWIFIVIMPCSNTVVLFSQFLYKLSTWGPLAIMLMHVFSLFVRENMPNKEKVKLPLTFVLFFALFIFWLILSYFWSIDQDKTFHRILYYLRQNIPIVYIVIAIIKTNEHIASLMKAYVLGCFVSVAAIFYAFSFGISFGSDFSNRYAAAGFDPNDLALILCLGIPMAWYIAVREKRKVLDLLLYIYIPFCVAAIFLTGSRGAFIAALIAISIIPMTYFKQSIWLKMLLLFIASATIYAVSILIPPVIFERFYGISEELQRGSLSQRFYIWKAGLQVFQEHAIFGAGAGTFYIAVSKFFGGRPPSHNAFLSVLAEEGIIGFMFFISMLVVLINNIRFLPSLQRNVWLVLMLTWTVGASSLTWDYYSQTWFLFGLAAAQISVHDKTLENKT